MAALGIAVLVYAVVGTAALGVLGESTLADSTAPLADAVEASGWTWATGPVRVGAALASLGALLALVTGLGRTGFAMARENDLPLWLAAVHPRFRVPPPRRGGPGRGGLPPRGHRRPARGDRLLLSRWVRRSPGIGVFAVLYRVLRRWRTAPSDRSV